MADNFNLAKFLRNNRLLNESIGGYRDIKPMREAESITDNEFKKGDLVRIKADQDYGNDEYMGVDQARFKDLKGQRLKVTGTHDGGKTVWINDVDSLPASYLELDDPKKNAPIRVTPDNEVGADDELGSSGWGMSEANEGDEEQAYFDYKRSGEDDIDDVDPLPSLSPKFNISQDDFFGRMMDLAHEEFMGISDIVSMTIDSLRHGGFDDRDILNFLATDFSLDEGLAEAVGERVYDNTYQWDINDSEGVMEWIKDSLDETEETYPHGTFYFEISEDGDYIEVTKEKTNYSQQDLDEDTDFTRFYKPGSVYDNGHNPIGGFREFTVVSVDPDNQTVTVKGDKGAQTFNAYQFGRDYQPADNESEYSKKFGPGGGRLD